MMRYKVNPLVSVVTPAYNAGSFLQETIESVLAQTYKNFEFIIINDCSTDNTLEIIKHFALKDKRIKVFSNKKNLGIAGNRNKGVELASGKYLMWQDADDISMQDRMELQVSKLESDNFLGIVGGYLEFFDERGSTSTRKYPVSDSHLRKMFFRYSPVAQPAAMIRLSILKTCGEYDLNLPPAEDLDMLFRIARVSEMANIPKVVIKYRESMGSATFSSLRRMERNTFKIRIKYLKQGYRPSILDILFNIAQVIGFYTIPANIKIKLFKKIRNANL